VEGLELLILSSIVTRISFARADYGLVSSSRFLHRLKRQAGTMPPTSFPRGRIMIMARRATWLRCDSGGGVLETAQCNADGKAYYILDASLIIIGARL
jgi:hypothetical protein